jgi:uncharacterized protein (DUF1499 family)
MNFQLLRALDRAALRALDGAALRALDRAALRALGCAAALCVLGWPAQVPAQIGGAVPVFSALARSELRPCGGLLSFNCVSSVSARDDERHRVEPFRLRLGGPGGARGLSPLVAWERVRKAVEDLPRVTVVQVTDSYLRAEVRSSWFGFPDDVELTLRPVSRRIHVRSKSRRFPADFGVNRKRVEELRIELMRRGVIE